MAKIKELKVGTEEFMISLWDKFDEIMRNEGYNLIVNTDTTSIPRGTICFSEKDKYVPIILLNIWEDTELSVFIQDRNGNAIITGNTVVIYKFSFSENDDKDYIEKRFNQLIDYVLKEYKKYNKQNRLDFDIDKDELKRIVW